MLFSLILKCLFAFQAPAVGVTGSYKNIRSLLLNKQTQQTLPEKNMEVQIPGAKNPLEDKSCNTY